MARSPNAAEHRSRSPVAAGRRGIEVLAHDLINEVLAARLRLDAIAVSLRNGPQRNEGLPQALDAILASLNAIGEIAAEIQKLPDSLATRSEG